MEDVTWEMHTKPRNKVVLEIRDAKVIVSQVIEVLDIQFLLSVTSLCYTDKSNEMSGYST